jgi:L-threonylcarbamoyladenylate synthase
MNVSNLHHDESQRLHRVLHEPARILADGGLIAFPTETVYGLGANAFNEEAVLGIFSAKGRPADNPLIVHIAHIDDISKVADENFVPSQAMQKAMDVFWPGPLTIIMPVNRHIAKAVHPNMDTVGVRMPAHPVARTLIELSGCPIAAPSANQSGRPSPTTAFDVIEDMDGRIDGVVDGGDCSVGLESTVVAITDTEAVIYRPGGITKEQLEAALKIPVSLDPHLTSQTSQTGQTGQTNQTSGQFAPKSPGMKYRHYAPNAEVDVWWGEADRVREAMLSFYRNLPEAEQAATAVIAPAGVISPWPGESRQVWTGGQDRGMQDDSSKQEWADKQELTDCEGQGRGMRDPVDRKVLGRAGSEDHAGHEDKQEHEDCRKVPGMETWAVQLSHVLFHQLREFDRLGMKRILICGVDPSDGIGSALMNRLQKSSEGRIHAV